ncbi:MAG: transposase, partial [Lachnospiraceae bacterium]
RLNCELKRRSDVIKVFPNAASLLRTMGAVIMEYNDRYSMMKSLFYKITKTKLDDKTRSKLQEIAFAQKSLLEAA